MEIMKVFDELFPLNRCISGQGLRESLGIINGYVPLTVTEYPSGMDCYDWQVPPEWNIYDAYVANSKGEKLIDFQNNNLHVLAYCAPFEGWVSMEELKKHFYTLEDMPDAIPYITSVYEERWGFCLKHSDLESFTDDHYYVHIDSKIEAGSISLGQAFLKGSSQEEVIIFSHTGHPSMANDQLSGILTLMLTYDKLRAYEKDLRYTYRFMFCPETIGTAAFLSLNHDQLKNRFVAGYTATFIGDKSPLKYKMSLKENTLGDKAAINAMKSREILSFTTYGSDERHFNAPGIDLPFGAFYRAGPYGYPEYHTSLDNRSVISEQALEEASDILVETLLNIEAERKVITKHLGFEPKLDKLNLFPTLGKKYGHKSLAHEMLAIWRYSSKYTSLIDIANAMGVKAYTLNEALETAERIGLVTTER